MNARSVRVSDVGETPVSVREFCGSPPLLSLDQDAWPPGEELPEEEC